MLHIHRIILSSLCISSILFGAGPTNQDQKHNNPFPIEPLYPSEIPQEIREVINGELSKQHSQPPKETNIFDGEDVEEMEFVFENAPNKARNIVNYLQDPTYFPSGVDFRSAFFVGEPGSGKTITAKAIAYKMSQKGWQCKFILSTSLCGEYRNQTAIQLRQELEKIELSDKPTIIIIDELHRLLENADSKHHDADITSTALWTFLDKHKSNKNFFFIGTMNRVNKLPKPFKDRIRTGYIPFPLITDSQFKIQLLRKNLTIANAELDKDITDDFLNEELKKIGSCSGRNLKLLSFNILMMHETNKEKKPLLIKKELIRQAINEYMRDDTVMEYDITDETDEQRQERHHKENINLQKESLVIQKENQHMQQQHFIIQQGMQLGFFIWARNEPRDFAYQVIGKIFL